MHDFSLKPYITTPEHAAKIADWINTRGGIAIWLSADFSRPGETLTTPARTADGEPYSAPVWWVNRTPEVIITDPADVLISEDREVKRFYVAVRLGDQGLKLKCTVGATRRIRAAVAKAGEGAYYSLDHANQEAVIYKPESQLPLVTWLANHP